MKKLLTIAVCIVLFCTQTVCADGLSELYRTDFSSSTGIVGDAVITTDPTDRTNNVLGFASSDYVVTDIRESLDLTNPINIEGKIYREYDGTDNPYWDFRLFLLTDTQSALLSAFGKNVYLGSAWENISIYDYTDGAWSDFRIRLTRDEENVLAELYLDGNFYGSVTESLSGEITGIRLASLTGEGAVYIDDISYITEEAELTDLMSAVENETAEKTACEKWLGLLSGKTSQTAEYCYDKILLYAGDKGYIEIGELAASHPKNGEEMYAGDRISYAFFGNIEESSAPTVLLNGNPVTAIIKKNVITVEASPVPGESYTLSISGLKTENDVGIDFEDVSFTTKNIPVVSVSEGESYPYGTVVSWEELPNVSLSAKITDTDGECKELQNGEKLTLCGNLILTLKTQSDEHSISLYVIPNSAPEAKNVKLTQQGNTLKGSYEYYDADGDSQNHQETVIGWYTSSTKEGEYTLYQTGDSLDITESVYDKYIKFGVTAVSDAEPAAGDLTMSDIYLAPFRPVANNVYISGNPGVGGTLVGYYDYFDVNGDKENADSLMEWIDKNGNVVATGAALVLQNNHAGRELAFRVTVKNNVAPAVGEAVISNYVTVSGSYVSGGGSGGGGFGGSSGGNIIVGGNSGSGGSGGFVSGPVDIIPLGEYSDTVNHWAKEAVKALSLAGVVNGISDREFNPDGTVTRAELVTMIMRAKKSRKAVYGGMFEDVQTGAWYADYVQMAVDEGIVSPVADFRPDDPVTRQEAAKLMGTFLDKAYATERLTFSDSESVSDWAVPYVEAAVGAGFFKGDDKGNFNPLNSMTRAEAATILHRALGGGDK